MRQFNSHSLAESTDKSFNFNSLPTISAFPKDEKNWRIDWFGEIAFPNRLIRRKQPSVLVHLSRIISDRYEEDPTLLLSPESTSPARFQRKIWISIGTLPMLRVGDIWRNGQLVSQPDYELEEFPNILVNRDTTHLVKAGLNLNDKGFLLPLSEHPWHMHCTQSYCVLVELADSRRIIIPCIELIRFYFGSSSNLIAKLFQPPLERKSLYSNAHYDKSNGRLNIHLAETISGMSAADIGRIYQSKAAWHAAVQISNSILAASVNKQETHPQCLFPFEGATNLIASGKWLSFQDNPRATFIVYSLRSCTHPFPFRSLQYETTKKSDTTHPKQLSTSADPHFRSAARDARNQNLLERDASNSLTPSPKPYYVSPRFPDLSNKTIWRSKILVAPDRQTTSYAAVKNELKDTSFGKSGSKQRVRSIDLTVLLNTDKSKRKPIPEFLNDSIAELTQLLNYRIKLLTESDDDGWTVPISIFCDEEGEIDMKLFVEDKTHRLRPRRVAIFSIDDSTQQFIATLVESTPTHINIYKLEDPLEEEFDLLLSMTTTDYISHQEPQNVSICKYLEKEHVGYLLLPDIKSPL